MPCLTGRDQLQSVAVRPPQTRVQRRRHTVQHCTYVMMVCRRAALARGCGRGLHVVRFIKDFCPSSLSSRFPHLPCRGHGASVGMRSPATCGCPQGLSNLCAPCGNVAMWLGRYAMIAAVPVLQLYVYVGILVHINCTII